MSFFEKNYSNLNILKNGKAIGFRDSQLGALYSIAAHFMYNTDPGIITMPTGSGKSAVIMTMNNPASVSLLSGDRKPQIRF